MPGDEKQLPLIGLLAACDTDGCPVCTLIENRVDRYLESILYEQVNDVFFRARLRTDRGFCNRHSHALTDRKDPLGVAMIQRELVGNALEHPAKKPGRKKKSCMVCSLEDRAEKEYRDAILDNLGNPDLRKKLENGPGLCIPHYRTVAAKKLRLPGWFKKLHEKRYAAHLALLNKFISSYNAALGDKRPVLAADEKTAWQRSVRLLFGYRGRTGGR